MTEEKYCPLQKEGVKCAPWCAWYDEAEQQCAVMNIAAELISLGESINYKINERTDEQ